MKAATDRLVDSLCVRATHGTPPREGQYHEKKSTCTGAQINPDSCCSEIPLFFSFGAVRPCCFLCLCILGFYTGGESVVWEFLSEETWVRSQKMESLLLCPFPPSPFLFSGMRFFRPFFLWFLAFLSGCLAPCFSWNVLSLWSDSCLLCCACVLCWLMLFFGRRENLEGRYFEDGLLCKYVSCSTLPH